MNPNIVVKGVLGKTPQRKLMATRDSDRDGVINVLDCEPNNPKKQGIIHTIGAKVAEKFGAEKTAERIKSRGRFVDETKIQVREERRKQERETALFREKEKGRLARKAVGRSPQALGYISGIVQNERFAFPKKTFTRKVTRKGKKGRAIARTVVVGRSREQRQESSIEALNRML